MTFKRKVNVIFFRYRKHVFSLYLYGRMNFKGYIKKGNRKFLWGIIGKLTLALFGESIYLFYFLIYAVNWSFPFFSEM